MRDSHRMKEKYDLSLDNRQIVSLLIGGIVVMGAVFVLGVVVGKQLAGSAQTSGAPDLLSALDARAEAMAEVEKDTPLTFQDELTRKSAAAEPLPPPPAAVKMAAPAPAPEKVAEAPKPPPPPEEDDGPATPIAKALPQKQSGKVEAAPVPTRTATGLKEAIERAQQPKPTEAVANGAFTLQLSAYQSRSDADRFASKLRDRGYAPYIVEASVPKKGTWYRVRMGRFASKDAAGRYLADFKRETQLNAFVTGAQ